MPIRLAFSVPAPIPFAYELVASGRHTHPPGRHRGTSAWSAMGMRLPRIRISNSPWRTDT
jgi:hypothetical protein